MQRDKHTRSKGVQRISLIILKTCLWLIASLLFILVSAFVALRFPKTQNFIAGKATVYLSKKIKTKVELKKIRINFPASVSIEGLYLEDEKLDTLFYGEHIDIDIALWRLFSKKLEVSDIELQNITAHLSREKGSGKFNFDFIAAAFASAKKDTVPVIKDTLGAWKFDLNRIVLKNIDFTYRDDQNGKSLDLQLGNLETRIKKFDPDHKIFRIGKTSLSDSKFRFIQLETNKPGNANDQATPLPELSLDETQLERVQVVYHNLTNSEELACSIGTFSVAPKKVDLSKLEFDLHSLSLHDSQIKYTQNKVFTRDTLISKTGGSSPHFSFSVKELDLENNTLTFNNSSASQLKQQFDPNHVFVQQLTLKGKDLSLGRNKARLDIVNTHFKEHNGFNLKSLQGELYYDSSQATIKNLDLHFNNSHISQEFDLQYHSLATLKDSLSQVRMYASFKETKIDLKDLLYFSPDILKKLPLKKEQNNTVLFVSGKIKGTTDDLTISKLDVRTLRSTEIKIDGVFKKILDLKTIYASTSFQIKSTDKDIKSMLVDTLIPKDIQLPGSFSLSGTYKGYIRNFDASLNAKTSFGNAEATITMNPKTNNEQTYEAKLRTQNFDAGKLLNRSDLVGPITLTASAKGKGFDTSNLDAEVRITLIKAFLKNYEYKNFSLNGRIKKQSFNGSASMHDENLVFDFSGNVDLSLAHPKYTFTLNLLGADLKALRLSDEDLRVAALISSDLGPDLTGSASISNALIVRNGHRFPIDSVVLNSTFKNEETQLDLRSGILTAQFKGNMTLKELPLVMKQHFNSYFNLHDAEKTERLTRQKFDFTLNVYDPTLITSNFIPKLKSLTPFTIKGSYNSTTKNISLSTTIEQIKYDDLVIDTLKLNINSDANKLQYDLRLAELSNNTLKFENALLSGEVKNNILRFSASLAKDDSLKMLVLKGELKSMDHAFELKFDPDLVLNTQSWNIDRGNFIHFEKSGFYVNRLNLSNGTQLLSLDSKEKTPGSPLELKFKNFEISSFSRLAENKKELAKGVVNGDLVLEKQNDHFAFRSDLVINDLIFQSAPIGTVRLKASNFEASQKYDLDLSIEGNGNDLVMKGFYRASAAGQIDLLLNVKHLNLASVEPFTFDQLSRMSGSMQGSIHLKGALKAPVIEGYLDFDKAAFKPKIMDSYLMVQESRMSFASEKIRFDNFILRDSLDHTATLNGSIDLHNLETITLDLHLKTEQFLALNTTKEDNSLYYGTLIMDSDIRIKGTTDAPTVDAKIKLDKGSTITYIKPESQITKNESKGVVEFINPSNKEISIIARQNDSLEGISKIKGIELNASVNIDRSVQLKMIVDRSTGDSLYVKGGGLLDFNLDRSGKTSLSGKYTISDGGYYLSLENLVKRNFKIQKGSTVTWSGDMLDPYVELTAVYSIKTSPLDLVQDELAGVSEFEKNKYRNLLTFLVYLKMTGFVSTPEISFDIQLSAGDRGALNGTVNTKLAQLREDESQLNKQVFALLTLRRFVGENPLESNGEGGGLSSASRSSASKVLTQQLSSLSERYVTFVNLDVGVNSFEDYSTGTQQGRTQVQLGVSKKLFNERFTVRVGGNVDVEGDRASQNTANDVAGDISLDYKLTEDGRYKLEASRENQYTNPIEGELTKTAAGVVYTRNFNTFRQLLKKPEKGEKEKRKLKEKQKKLEDRKKEKQDEAENGEEKNL